MRTEALARGRRDPVATTDFGAAIPMNFVFAPDGKQLYGSSFYTGVANLFRCDLGDRGEGGPQQHGDGLLPPRSRYPTARSSRFRFTGEGFVPARVEARVTRTSARSPSSATRRS